MRFLPFFFRTTQRKRGTGRRRAAPSRPLLEASRGGGGDRPSTSFGQDVVCRRRRRAEAREEGELGKTKWGCGVGSKEIKQQVDGEEEGRGLTHGSTSQGAKAEASRDEGEPRRRLVTGSRRVGTEVS